MIKVLLVLHHHHLRANLGLMNFRGYFFQFHYHPHPLHIHHLHHQNSCKLLHHERYKHVVLVCNKYLEVIVQQGLFVLLQLHHHHRYFHFVLGVLAQQVIQLMVLMVHLKLMVYLIFQPKLMMVVAQLQALLVLVEAQVIENIHLLECCLHMVLLLINSMILQDYKK